MLLVEGSQTSGAMITANLAAEQGRDVFAVPGNIDVPSSAGTNALIRDGARLVMNAGDILSELAYLYPDLSLIHISTSATAPAIWPL